MTNGRLAAGEAVLVQGVTSSMGIAAFQIAKAKRARLVIGSSTSDAKLATLKGWGLDQAARSFEPMAFREERQGKDQSDRTQQARPRILAELQRFKSGPRA